MTTKQISLLVNLVIDKNIEYEYDACGHRTPTITGLEKIKKAEVRFSRSFIYFFWRG